MRSSAEDASGCFLKVNDATWIDASSHCLGSSAVVAGKQQKVISANGPKWCPSYLLTRVATGGAPADSAPGLNSLNKTGGFAPSKLTMQVNSSF